MRPGSPSDSLQTSRVRVSSGSRRRRSSTAWLMRLELGGYAERSIIRTRAALYALDLLRRIVEIETY